jgi:hypothetical protein
MVRMIGTAARAVWNGPFYIGKLARPVSLGDVAMKLLETIWRGAILLVAAITVATVVAIALDARPVPPALKDQIVGAASVGNPDCDATYPLHVALQNKSKERVGTIMFNLEAYEPGRSTNLLPLTRSSEYISDLIIPAGKTGTMCFQVPPLTEERPIAGLRFVINITSALPTELP